MTKRTTIALLYSLVALSLASPVDGISTSLNLFLVSAVAVGGIAWRAFKKEPPYRPAANSLQDKLVVITGGTGGLGLESGKRLAAAGATVILTSRTAAKGNIAVEEVTSYLAEQNANGNAIAGEIYSATLDLEDLETVKSFPERLNAVLGLALHDKKIDILINNAGIMAKTDRHTTKDDFEQAFQSNHLGHFVLTATLFERMIPEARIINVSSDAYKFVSGGLPINDLNGEKFYSALYNYGVSKLANIMFTKELQRRAGTTGLKSFSLHVGAVQTDIFHSYIGAERWEKISKDGPTGLYDMAFVVAMALFTPKNEDGASTQIFLACADDEALKAVGAESGDYVIDMKPFPLPPVATNSNAAQQLWAESEKMSKITFAL